MRKKNIFRRVIIMPIGIIIKLAKWVAASSRDMDNKYRYKEAIIDEGCSFTQNCKIGKHSHILSNCIVNNSFIGSYTYFGSNCLIQNATIGNYCSISNEVILGLGTHPLDLFSTSTIFYKAENALGLQLTEKDLDFDEYSPINIGSDVWIGARVIVMDGIKIGHGAVLATGAIITKDVPPYAIVAGVPAKIIKFRFEEDIRNKLIATRWWENDAALAYAQRDELMSICKGSFSTSKEF